jgi:hypothetical protein
MALKPVMLHHDDKAVGANLGNRKTQRVKGLCRADGLSAG